MRLPGLLLAILFGALASPACAQSAARSNTSPPQVDLGNSAVALTDWKFHPGDNLAWAQPGYDDSGWTSVDLRGYANMHDPFFSSDTFVPGWTARGFPTLTGFAWYRTRFQVAGNNRDLWLAMPPNFDDVYQVYVNGKLVGAYGEFAKEHARGLPSLSMKFHLPAITGNGDVVLALRFYMEPDTPQWNAQAGGPHSAPVIGLASSIALLQNRNRTINLHTDFTDLPLGIAWAMAGIAALWIFLIERDEQAYLWLTAAFLLGAAAGIFRFFGGYVVGWVSLTQDLLVQDLAGAVFVPLFWLLFWAHWFRLRHLRLVVRLGWTLTVLELCVFACRRHYLFASLLPATWAHPVWLASVVLRIAFALLLLAITVAGIRQEPAEGWMALPAIVLLGIGLFNVDLTLIGLRVNYFPFGIHVDIGMIAWFALAVIVIALVLRRFLHTRVQQQELEREMEQARQVQSLLVPAAPADTPGFTVESVYLPASEVGGDFFQVQPGEDGSLLIVVGDVSGKGLKAAMTVSTIVGALRDYRPRNPAEVLAHLNRVVHGQISGFVTCCATLIAADGAMTIANAGHLSPYRNGEELAGPSALPLGILAEGSYEEMSFQLAPGDRLAFMSDGVVEARNHSGELYGFERTRQISHQTAAAIAETAQNFGQEDDITVLSIDYIGAGEMVSA